MCHYNNHAVSRLQIMNIYGMVYEYFFEVKDFNMFQKVYAKETIWIEHTMHLPPNEDISSKAKIKTFSTLGIAIFHCISCNNYLRENNYLRVGYAVEVFIALYMTFHSHAINSQLNMLHNMTVRFAFKIVYMIEVLTAWTQCNDRVGRSWETRWSIFHCQQAV